MKLRLLDDSIRLRLTQGEVAAAGEQQAVEASTRLPDGSSFRYAFEAVAGIGSATAGFAGGRLVVRLPAPEVSAWARDDEAVSLRGEIALPGGGTLRLLVEKDFRCLVPREGEDQSDLYSNPDSAC